MVEAFSQRVTDPAWLLAVTDWITDRVEEAGRRVTGPIDQLRVRAWSTQLIVPTDRGKLWFKANCPSMAFEPALHDVLARMLPDDFDRPFAVNPASGWIMTVDRGATFGDSRPPTETDWRDLLASAARIQHMIASSDDEIAATGLPICTPATVVERFDRLTDLMEAVHENHPAKLDRREAANLRSARSRVVEASEQLRAGPIPASLQHGDLHPWNVFEVDNSLRIFDFGDAQWAHAFEVLSVPRGWIASESELEWTPIFEAYLEAWGDVADYRELVALEQATAFTQPINRALTWWDCLQDATAEELAEWGTAPRHHLLRVLAA